MIKQTVTTLGVATLYGVCLFAVLLYAYITVSSQKGEVYNLKSTVAAQLDKQSAARTVASTIVATESVRQDLASHFLSEKDTISFIANIETLANSLSVKIETTALDIIRPTDGSPELKTGFTVTGNRTAVLGFMSALETLPYHSRMPVMKLDAKDGSAWQGNVELFVTMTP